jgi:Lon protease-like protein
MADTPEEELIYEDRSQLPEILPIFPLPNVVLMPNASLPLFIFEDRYKEMIHDCLEGEPYLAIALLKKGWEQQSGPPRPHPIAGFGRIVRAARLPNDCMDIVVQGMGRIEMTEFYDDRAYLRAAVTLFRPTSTTDNVQLREQAETMRRRFLDLLDLKGVTALELRTHLKLLASPIDLVFFIVAHLPLDPYGKQEILQTREIEAQMAQVINILDMSRGSQLN